MSEQPEMTPGQRKELEEKLKNMSPEQIAQLQKQQCIFCQIISGKVPAKKIYEDETCLAVLDIYPATKGHLLVIPKEHFAIMPQVPDTQLGHLFAVSKALSQVLLKALKVSGTSVFIANGQVAGQRAPHFMIHLVPRKDGDGLFPSEEKVINQELVSKIKVAITPALNKLLGVVNDEQTTLTAKEDPEVEPDNENYQENIDGDEADDILDKLSGKDSNVEDQEKDGEGSEDNEAEGGEGAESVTVDNNDSNEVEEDDNKKDNGGASLDDIANLFK
jgi:histidine triad (HIT) family protein